MNLICFHLWQSFVVSLQLLSPLITDQAFTHMVSLFRYHLSLFIASKILCIFHVIFKYWFCLLKYIWWYFTTSVFISMYSGLFHVFQSALGSSAGAQDHSWSQLWLPSSMCRMQWLIDENLCQDCCFILYTMRISVVMWLCLYMMQCNQNQTTRAISIPYCCCHCFRSNQNQI